MSTSRAAAFPIGVVFALCFGACGERTIDLYPALGDDPPAKVCDAGEVRACYAGPEGTEGVGACVAGSQVCEPHERGWSSCDGQVMPTQDACDGQDANCDGIATCGDSVWVQRWGAPRDETVTDVAADASGNVFVTGYYREAIDLGTGPLPLVDDSRDMFVAKLDPDGAPIWVAAVYAGAGHVVPFALALGPDGSVVVAASANGTIQHGGTTPSNATLDGLGDDDALIVKLDANGGLSWWRRFGDPASQFAQDVAVDGAGNVFATGYFFGAIDFGDGAIATVDAGADVFALALSPDGELIWSRVIGGNGDGVGRGVALDAAGDPTITGYFLGELISDDRLFESAGDRDVFVIALAGADGQTRYTRIFGDAREQRAQALAIDASGAAIVVGRTEGPVDWGGGERPVDAGGAMFVVKLSAAGEHVWSQHLGGPSDQGAYGVAVDSRGRAVVSGFYEGTFSFGATSLPEGGLGEPNVVVLELESDGAPVWARGLLVDGEQSAPAVSRAGRVVAVDGGDNVLLGGYVEGDMDFGVEAAMPAGGTDAFVLKLTP